MIRKIMKSDIEALISIALAEDVGSGDITSEAIFREDETAVARIISKESGIFCGGDVIRYVYEEIDPAIRVEVLADDGSAINVSSEVAKISGATIGILAGERVTLNFIQRMSGIATRARLLESQLVGTGITILDTRKTLPGFRLLDKYAAAVGGCTNHRLGLYDMILIKDNHIRAAGSIHSAVGMVRELYGRRFTVEVEASSPLEVSEAADSGADIIMLDNMGRDMIIESISIIKKRAKIEVSGNISEERITELRDLAIDFISMGSLTHSVRAFDLSMKFI